MARLKAEIEELKNRLEHSTGEAGRSATKLADAVSKRAELEEQAHKLMLEVEKLKDANARLTERQAIKDMILQGKLILSIVCLEERGKKK